jgi:hypothetical protein
MLQGRALKIPTLLNRPGWLFRHAQDKVLLPSRKVEPDIFPISLGTLQALRTTFGE